MPSPRIERTDFCIIRADGTVEDIPDNSVKIEGTHIGIPDDIKLENGDQISFITWITVE